MAELKVFTVLSEINSLMDNCKKVPFSGMIMLDRQRMDQLLDKLRVEKICDLITKYERKEL